MSQPTTVNKCGIKGYVPPPASQLARAGGNNCPNCASNYGYQICSLSPGRVFSTYQLDQRRKVEIMQYKNNSAHLSRAQQYSMASRNALTRKKSWATQTQTYTNPNVDNLPEVQIPINNVLSTVGLSCIPLNKCIVNVALGFASNTIAYSSDGGMNWTGLGASIFSNYGNGAAWSQTQSRWVAVGYGTTNTIAYSPDGINWTGIGTSIFAQGYGVTWNQTQARWVAVGFGTNKIAYSYDGMNWIVVPGSSAIFSNFGNDAACNGTKWVAVGSGTNTIANSNDGITWTGVPGSTGIFSNFGSGIAWSQAQSQWVAVGSGTNSIAYSPDGINWTAVPGSTGIFTIGRKVEWNGTLWVAVGQGTNTIAYSTNGISWTGLGATGPFTSIGYGISWNGTRWVAVGTGTNTIAYSSDGINWIPAPGSTGIFSSGIGVGSRSTCNPPNITCNLTSDCDVPGPVIPLCVDYSVPLYNYRPQITYSSGRSYYIVPPTIKPTPVPSVLINTQNFAEPIGTSIYYLAQGPILYVMPAGSFMTSFSVNIDGTNNSIIFQNASGSNLFTWTDNQTRTVTVSTVVNLTTAVNISGCTQFTFGNPQGALASYTSTGTPLLGIIIYGYVQ